MLDLLLTSLRSEAPYLCMQSAPSPDSHDLSPSDGVFPFRSELFRPQSARRAVTKHTTPTQARLAESRRQFFASDISNLPSRQIVFQNFPFNTAQSSDSST